MKPLNLLNNLAQSRAVLIDPKFLQSLVSRIQAEASTLHFEESYGFAEAEGPLDENGIPCSDENGVLTIPIDGVLIHNKLSIHLNTFFGWVTSYAYITEMIEIAINSEDVKEVRLSINSPGGYVMGCFKTCGELRKLSSLKKTKAVINGMCCSAAYMLAANAEFIEAYPSSDIGSIGAVCLLTDWSKNNEKFGLKEYAVGWPHGKTLGRTDVDEEALAKAQKHIMAISKDIEKSVELRLDRKKIEELDADIFTTNEALTLGLVDAVITPEQTFNIETKNKENTEMSNENQKQNPAGAGQSSGTPPLPLAVIPKAEGASPPDNDTQKEILGELKTTNGLLMEIRDLLKKDEAEEETPPPADGGQGQAHSGSGFKPSKAPPMGLINGEQVFGEQNKNQGGTQPSAEEQLQSQAAKILDDIRKK